MFGITWPSYIAVGSTSAGDGTADRREEGKFLSVAGTLRDKMYYRNLVSLIL